MKSDFIKIGMVAVCCLLIFSKANFVHAGVNTKRYWIFFKDKETELFLNKSGQELCREIGLSDRALKRRAKTRATSDLLDKADVPVSEKYISALETFGIRKHTVSRWLNAISAEIPDHLIDTIEALPFVRKIKRVQKYPIENPQGGRRPLQKADQHQDYNLDYGYSFIQNELIHVPEVHQLDITGKDVLIGVIDTGFDHQGRSVFSRMHVIAEYDFHWNDEVTANEENDSLQQHDHGTAVLSVIGGFKHGYLIGPAYNATYALAKTEWISVTDDTLEEDHWVAAIEWLEALGVDVVNSSVGYYYFVNGPDYTYEQLDGNTCETTIAADIAVSKGVVVVSSAGNEGRSSWHYVTPPSDGDSVIAVGAVTMNNNIWQLSSVGPTYDGRTKPDVVAMGVGVVTINPDRDSDSKYLWVSGTSVSAPQVAGICALVLGAHPELGPMDVRDAIRNTADRAENRDNEYGWGLVNAYEAIFHHGMIFRNFKYMQNLLDQSHSIELEILSKHGILSDSVFIYFLNPNSEIFQSVEMNRMGDDVSKHYKAICPQDFLADNGQFYISAIDSNHVVHIGPVRAPNVLYSFSDQLSNSIVVGEIEPVRFELHQNYPNPFNANTTILFDVSQEGRFTLKLYDILGRYVRTLYDGNMEPGRKEIVWNGKDECGNRLASGLYFCELRGGRRRTIRKMILIN